MTDEQWDNWLNRYSTTFRMTSDKDVLMLHSWRAIFVAKNATYDELEACIVQVGLNPPAYREEHLRAILRHLDQMRAEAFQTSRPMDPVEGEIEYWCGMCNDTGWVSVPHLECVRDGRFVPHPRFQTCYQMCVTCNCKSGEWIYQSFVNAEARGKEKKRPMRLGDYESRNPQWREQMRAREEEQRQEFVARAHAGHLDGLFGKLAKHITERGGEDDGSTKLLTIKNDK